MEEAKHLNTSDMSIMAQSSRGPDDEATSKETLDDLEESQTTPATPGDIANGGSKESSSAPSPDGAFDEQGGGGRADGGDTGGPM